jgi:hypothetical protein
LRKSLRKRQRHIVIVFFFPSGVVGKKATATCYRRLLHFSFSLKRIRPRQWLSSSSLVCCCEEGDGSYNYHCLNYHCLLFFFFLFEEKKKTMVTMAIIAFFFSFLCLKGRKR